MRRNSYRRTMLIVELNVITANIRGHGDNWSFRVELTDQMTGRHTIQVGHDDIHQNKIILGSTLHLVHSLQPIELEVLLVFLFVIQ